MKSIYSFIVPEYYPDFKCKTSECRHPCCEGWKISISMNEYFRLTGMQCPKDIRRRLDCALTVTGGTGEEHYAEIHCDYNGRCKLHREDGLCSIQAELGEEYLPSICRYYPRAIKHAHMYKSVCANSCEAVIEKLSEFSSPLRFINNQQAVENEPYDKAIDPEEFSVEQHCIDLVQDRRYSLPDRLSLLCDYLWSEPAGDNILLHTDIKEALGIQHSFTVLFESNSPSVRDFCYEARKFYGTEDKDELTDAELEEATSRYEAGKKIFEDTYLKWQTFFENIFVNHMFYQDFPYSDNYKNRRGAFISLAAAYSFLRFNAIGYCAQNPSRTSLFDVTAAMFRLIEHSGFDRNAVAVLKKLNYVSPDKLKNLVYI